MLYEFVVCHNDYPKKTFVMYDWVEEGPGARSKSDLRRLLEARLVQRADAGYRILSVHVVRDLKSKGKRSYRNARYP